MVDLSMERREGESRGHGFISRRAFALRFLSVRFVFDGGDIVTESLSQVTLRSAMNITNAQDVQRSLVWNAQSLSLRLSHLTRPLGWTHKPLHWPSLLRPIQKDPGKEEGARSL